MYARSRAGGMRAAAILQQHSTQCSSIPSCVLVPALPLHCPMPAPAVALCRAQPSPPPPAPPHLWNRSSPARKLRTFHSCEMQSWPAAFLPSRQPAHCGGQGRGWGPVVRCAARGAQLLVAEHPGTVPHPSCPPAPQPFCTTRCRGPANRLAEPVKPAAQGLEFMLISPASAGG